MANELVLVDTSYWIEYFNRPGTEKAVAVETLVRDDEAALTGVILAELLQGARTAKELSELRSALLAVIWVATTDNIYARAGRLGFELRRRGVTIPTTDCIIAAAAEPIGGRVLTLDSHFREIALVAPFTILGV